MLLVPLLVKPLLNQSVSVLFYVCSQKGDITHTHTLSLARTLSDITHTLSLSHTLTFVKVFNCCLT